MSISYYVIEAGYEGGNPDQGGEGQTGTGTPADVSTSIDIGETDFPPLLTIFSGWYTRRVYIGYYI